MNYHAEACWSTPKDWLYRQIVRVRRQGNRTIIVDRHYITLMILDRQEVNVP